MSEASDERFAGTGAENKSMVLYPDESSDIDRFREALRKDIEEHLAAYFGFGVRLSDDEENVAKERRSLVRYTWTNTEESLAEHKLEMLVTNVRGSTLFFELKKTIDNYPFLKRDGSKFLGKVTVNTYDTSPTKGGVRWKTKYDEECAPSTQSFLPSREFVLVPVKANDAYESSNDYESNETDRSPYLVSFASIKNAGDNFGEFANLFFPNMNDKKPSSDVEDSPGSIQMVEWKGHAFDPDSHGRITMPWYTKEGFRAHLRPEALLQIIYSRAHVHESGEDEGGKAPILEYKSDVFREPLFHLLSGFVAWNTTLNLKIRSADEQWQALIPSEHELNTLPSRPVELDSFSIYESLKDKKIYLPYRVIEAACTSLNSGKNVILTGPPGCGKTVLAKTLANAITDRWSGKDALISTATPSWTNHDLIGRYFPDPSGDGLYFQEGFFLSALREERCLVIDEFNRAPIDQCLGPLFTVLAGEDVELPYKYHAKGSEGQMDGEPFYQIVHDKILESEDSENVTDAIQSHVYHLPQNFRIVATMNDFDRYALNSLSFALLRRFDIIRVEAPSEEEMGNLIDQTLGMLVSKQKNMSYSFVSRGSDGVEATSILQGGDEDEEICVFKQLFAVQNNYDLVSGRVVGVATAKDVIQFMVEAFRVRTKANQLQADEDKQKALLHSYLAMALVLKVVPQLDALSDNNKNNAIDHMLDVLRDENFLRIKPAEESSYRFKTEVVKNKYGKSLTVHEYFKNEVRLHLGNTYMFSKDREQ